MARPIRRQQPRQASVVCRQADTPPGSTSGFHETGLAAFNSEITLARSTGAGDEACAIIREALTTSGDIIPGAGTLTIRLDPLSAPRRTRAIAALCDKLNAAGACYPGTSLTLRYEIKPNAA